MQEEAADMGEQVAARDGGKARGNAGAAVAGARVPGEGETSGREACEAAPQVVADDEDGVRVAPGARGGARKADDAQSPRVPDSFARPENEDDDGYDPWSDRPPRAEPLFERDPWD